MTQTAVAPEPLVIPPVVQGSMDRMALFFHIIGSSEGTLRAWHQRDQSTKLQYHAAYERPAQEKDEDPLAYSRRLSAWAYTMLGVIVMEALSQKPDRLVAQAAFDSLFPGRVARK